ncbi:MAG: family 43 glycosylhydrolase [Lachnospiraceae bacterium]|nr:family 43 glycosylhydrolase [Lachnospiraceae bacterium]
MNVREAIEQENLAALTDVLIHIPVAIDEAWEGLKAPYHAAATGNLEIVRYIVEYSRASFNETDDRNRTLLHYAVEAGKLPLVKYLVERVGLSPMHGDKERITPYQLVHELAGEAEKAEKHEAAQAGLTGVAQRKEYKKIEQYFEEYCGAKLEDMYKNPILAGMHPDPSIICVGDDFYMVNSSFIFFPCIPISHSKDLIHWEVIGHAVSNPEWARNLNTLESGRGYWAPDISYHNGRFYITATFRLNDDGTVYRKQMVTSSDKPEGPYCEPVYLDEDGIDPSIFTDDDGKRYMVLNRGARIFEISEDGKKQISEAELIYYGHQKRAPEGSHLLRKDGWYYLFQAEGGTGAGHRISVARSRTLKGVYEPCPYNPIVRQWDEKGALQCCGHGKPVCTPNGDWYIVYLCARQLDKGCSMLGRETAMDPLIWTADGWPLVNNGRGPSVLQKKPNLPEWIPENQTEDYVSPRVPDDGMIAIGEDEIILRAGTASLSTVDARSILVKRQTDFYSTLTVRVKMPEGSEAGEEFGITGYYDENTYLTFGPYCTESGMKLRIKEHIGDTDREYICAAPDSDMLSAGSTIELKMVTERLKRSFYIKAANGEWLLAAVLENVNYICSEGWRYGKRFTGAMEGIYAVTASGGTREIHFSRF